MKRHEARQFAVQALFAVDVGKVESDDAVQHVLEDEQNVQATSEAYILRLVQGTRTRVAEIDTMLETNVQGWRLDRIGKVELNVLRLACYELMCEPDVDLATVVDEAVELAKAFSNDAAGKFVNGVLAKVGPILRTTGG